MTVPARLDDGDTMDLRTLVSVVWRRRTAIAIWMLALTGLFAGIALLMTPVYRASAVLISASSGQNGMGGSLGSLLDSVGGLASQAGINLSNSDPGIEESLAVLKSRQLTMAFINENNLLPKLYAGKWNASAHAWKVPPEKQPTQARAYKKFDEHIRAMARDKKTGLVTLQIDWRDRIEAADWANELVRRVNAEMRARAIAKADASLVFLQKQLAVTAEVGTRDAISRLIETQEKQRMLANVSPDYAFRVVDRAMPADKDDPVRPKKIALLLAGPLAGFALGVAWVLLLHSLRPVADV